MRLYVHVFFCLTSIWALASAGPAAVSNEISSIKGAQSQIKSNADTLMARLDMISYVASDLTTSNPMFYRPNLTDGSYYYQAIRIDVDSTGVYSFISNSSLDTYGYLYVQSFIPSSPNTNLIAFDDDSGGANQFRINRNLDYGTTYILVVTTYRPNSVGRIGVQAIGPNALLLTLFRPDISSSTSLIPTTTYFPTTYSGSLSLTSPSFYRYPQTDALYFYQALRITISTPGRYTFISISGFDTYGYLYASSMDLSYPGQYILAYDDDSAGSNQFRIIYDFQFSGTYVLIVTSYAANTRGSFTIQSRGPAYASLTPFTPSTSRPILSSTTSTTLSPSSSYYGSLSSSRYFYRPGRNDGYYYYEALQFTVYTTGSYTFTSSSSMDTFGLLYNSPVDPSYSSLNLITSDDDSAGSSQFRINAYLQSSRTYVLIVTTFSSNVRGSYSIRASGPQSISFYSITPSTSRPIQTTTSYSYSYTTNLSALGIIGIVVGSVFVFAIFVSVVTYSSKQRMIHNRRVIRTVPVTRTVATNVTPPNGTTAPYTIPMQSVYVHSVEEPPPTYDQAAAYLKASHH